MNILRISSSLSPEKVGGIGVHVDEMSRMQGKMGHNVTVLTSDNGDKTLPRLEEREEYTVIRHRQVARPADNSIIPGLVSSIKHRIDKSDVIHAHSYLFFSTNIAALVSRITQTPFAITQHGMFPSSAPNLLKEVYIPTIGKFTLNSADTVFCYTETAENTLRDLNVTSPIRVIHNGIDCERFEPDNGLPQGDETELLFVGRVKEGKGVELLLNAFNSIKEEHPQVKLKIIGDGPLLPKLKAHYSSEDVLFTGEVPYDEIINHYQTTDVLVLPTATEAAIPRVVMEAWACEVPVIMTDIPQADQSTVKKGGLSLSDRSVAELVETIRHLLEEPELRESKGKTGREIVLENFSWRETVESTTDELKKISSSSI